MGILTDLEIEFLLQSNALAGISGIDYTDPTVAGVERGQAGAWLLLKEIALTRAAPSFDDICRAQQWIVAEHTGASTDSDGIHDDAALRRYLADLADDVAKPAPPRDFYGGFTIAVAGRSLHRFLHMRPLRSANGRMARLLTNYVLLRRNWPLVIFTETDRERLQLAVTDAQATGQLMVDKVRETVACGNCRVGRVHRTKHGREIDTYACAGCGAEFKLDWKGLLGTFRESCRLLG